MSKPHEHYNPRCNDFYECIVKQSSDLIIISQFFIDNCKIIFIHKKTFKAGQPDSFSINTGHRQRPKSVSSREKKLLFSPSSSNTGPDALDRLAVAISSSSLCSTRPPTTLLIVTVRLWLAKSLRCHDSLLRQLRTQFLSSVFKQWNVVLCSRTFWLEDEGAETPRWSTWWLDLNFQLSISCNFNAP